MSPHDNPLDAANEPFETEWQTEQTGQVEDDGKIEAANAIPKEKRKRIVVAGLGMVGMAFIEKLLKFDAKRSEYHVIVIGEEPHLAYNRVGLTSYFQHREVENLYLNPASWYASLPESSLTYQLDTRVTSIDLEKKTVETTRGTTIPYDVLVLATGSDAVLPYHTAGHDATGKILIVFSGVRLC